MGEVIEGWQNKFTADQIIILRERIAKLEYALAAIACHAARETNGLPEYQGDTYGFIFKIARETLGLKK